MTPKGLIAYIAGMALLAGGVGLALLTTLYVDVILPHGRAARSEGGLLLIVCACLGFCAFHLLSGGLYHMLVHLYHTVSRTDPAGDRRLRGRTVFVLGQISSWITVPVAVLFAAVAAAEANRPDEQLGLVLLGVLPAGFGVLLSLIAWSGGLAIMVRDLFLRHRDIVEKREAERRRRLEEADEPQTEVIPPDQPTPDALRQHIKEDR